MFEEFATIQHYVQGAEENFLKSLRLARSFKGSEPGSASRTGLLLDTLEANNLVRRGEIKAAVDCYRKRIRREVANHRALLQRRRWSEVSAELSQQHMVLGLLELNLAELLRKMTVDADEVERHYRQACAYIPDSPFLKESLASFFLSQKRWEQAIEQFKEAFTAGRGIDRDSRVLNSNLAAVYIEWARSLDPAMQPVSQPEESNTSELEELALARGVYRFAALQRLDEAVSTLKWDGIPSWEALFHFERASILEMGDKAKDAADAFLTSAQRYSDAGDAKSSANAFARRGDVLFKLGLLSEAVAAYEAGLKQAEAIADKSGSEVRVKREWTDSLLSKLAIIHLALKRELTASTHFERLVEQWSKDGPRSGAESWGPYYDIQSLGRPLLARSDLRHPLTIYYHGLLAKPPSRECARDLTAAILDLYKLSPLTDEGPTDGPEALASSAGGTNDRLNVVTPIAFEVGETLETLIANEDHAIRGSSTFAEADLKDHLSLVSKLGQGERPIDRYLLDRLSPEVRIGLARHEGSSAVSLSLQANLPELLRDLLNGILGGPSIYDAQRFAGVALRTETKQLLSQELKDSDLPRLNGLLLEDAYPLELSRNTVDRRAAPMRKRIEAEYAVRIPRVRYRPDPDLEGNDYRLLLSELIVATGTCASERLEQVFCHLEAVIAANLVEFVGHQEAQNYLERNALVEPTVEDISEKEHYNHMNPLTTVLRALVGERVPLTEANAIYAEFRSGWIQKLSVATIVENIRRIPEVRTRLWGNDANHTYLLLPSSLETLLADATRAADQSDYLVINKNQKTAIIVPVGNEIVRRERPALIVQRQEQRALLRQLIAPEYPEVPVLSVSELRPAARQIVEIRL